MVRDYRASMLGDLGYLAIDSLKACMQISLEKLNTYCHVLLETLKC